MQPASDIIAILLLPNRETNVNDEWDDEPLDEEDPSPESFLYTALIFEFGMAGIAVLLGWLFTQQPIAGLDFATADQSQAGTAIAIGLAATVPLLIVFGLIDRFGKALFADLDEIATERIRPLFEEINLAGLLLVSVAAGVGEEMLFRGFLQGMLADASIEPYGPWVSVLLAAIIFGLCHYMSFNYFVIATLMGCYLGGLWLWTDSLLVPITAHAAYDFVALVYITRFRGGES